MKMEKTMCKEKGWTTVRGSGSPYIERTCSVTDNDP